MTLKLETIAKQIKFIDNIEINNEALLERLKTSIKECLGTEVLEGNSNTVDILRKLENKNGLFNCFESIMEDVPWQPKYAVSYYRGLRVTDAKKKWSFASSKELLPNYNKFTKNYEDIHGEGRHTLNSLLADFAESCSELNRFFFCCHLSEEDKLCSVNNFINIHISNDTLLILLGEKTNFINEIGNDTSYSRNKNLLAKELEDKRFYALKSAIGGEEDRYKSLNSLLGECTKKLFCQTSEPSDSQREKYWMEIIQILQGICLFLKYFGGPLISMTTREFDKKTSYDCVGQFFIFCGNSSEHNDIIESCNKIFSRSIHIQQSYFKLVLQYINKSSSAPAYSALDCALQSTDLAKKIVARVGTKLFNFNTLAGVIRLAEIIRPFAVHEGRQRVYSFVVTYPYIVKERFKTISDLSGKIIDWEIPAESRFPKENEKLHEAKARITGSSQSLQGAGVALFVDCSERKPTINQVIVPDPRVLLDQNSDLVGSVADKVNAFIVKIIGQKKIEIIYMGQKILVWSHVNATWERESHWQPDSLVENIAVNLTDLDANCINTLKIVANAIYQLQQVGEGGSFVICKKFSDKVESACPAMTIPFPTIGEGKITDVDKLLNIAKEDGGTLISLTENKFSGRRQWLPRDASHLPFWRDEFSVPEEKWQEQFDYFKWEPEEKIKTKLEDQEIKDPQIQDTLTQDILDNSFPVSRDKQPKLYDLCQHKLLKLLVNGTKTYAENIWYWDDWYKVFSWGTRHISSMGMSAFLWDEAIVVVVSADSTISVFYKGIELKIQ